MPAPHDPMTRNHADGILEAVGKGGSIQMETLVELLALLKEKTTYRFHVAVEIKTAALLKTIDNEDDAQETIKRLKAAPSKAAMRQRLGLDP